MSCSRRRLPALFRAPALLAAALLLPLCGCGFEPLYGKQAQAEYDPVLAAIKVDGIPNATGMRLAQQLREELNPHDEAVTPRYRLHVTLAIARRDLGISRSATASRSEVLVTATYSLTDLGGDNRLFSNVSKASSLFNILDDGYATQVAMDNATNLAIEDVGREIELRLAFFARQQRGQG